MSDRTLQDLADDFNAKERPVGVLVDEGVVLAQLIAATRFYAGFGGLKAFDFEAPELEQIDAATTLTTSEWSLIRPLFILYVEKESALQLEASRGMGIDPYGRSSSEIASEITQAESEMPHRAFCIPFVEVGKDE